MQLDPVQLWILGFIGRFGCPVIQEFAPTFVGVVVRAIEESEIQSKNIDGQVTGRLLTTTAIGYTLMTDANTKSKC